MTTESEWADERQAQMNHQRLMGEHNPDTWDPDPDDTANAGSVNVIDPVRGDAVDVPGHKHDRPADMDEEHARRLALRGAFDDLDDDQPLPLLASSMSTDPVEGTHGSYRVVTRLGDACPKCGHQYGIHICGSTLGEIHMEVCLACDADISGP